MTVIKAEIRDQIIDAASRIFSRFGFKKTTMDEIAQSMHKGKSSIYYYFASKEEIFEAVVEKEAQQLQVQLHEAIDSTDVPQDKLKMYVNTRIRAFRNMANFYEAIKSDYLSHLDFINKIRRKYDEDEITVIENILKNGVENNRFRVENTTLTAIAIATAMKGLEVPLFWSNQSPDVEKHIDNVLSVLFYGIVKQ